MVQGKLHLICMYSLVNDTLFMNVLLEVQGKVKMFVSNSDNVLMHAKIDQISSNPEIKVHLAGRFCMHF